MLRGKSVHRYIGFALILNSGRHGRLRRSSHLPHPILSPHLDASNHPSIHAGSTASNFVPSSNGAGTACFNRSLESPGLLHPRCQPIRPPGLIFGPLHHWTKIRSGVAGREEWCLAVFSLICSPFARLLHGHGGRGPCPSIPTPDSTTSTTQLSFKFSSGRSLTPEIGGVAPSPQSCLWRAGNKQSGPCFIKISKTEYSTHSIRCRIQQQDVCGFCRLRACQPRHTLRKRAPAARDRDVPGAACPRGVYPRPRSKIEPTDSPRPTRVKQTAAIS